MTCWSQCPWALVAAGPLPVPLSARRRSSEIGGMGLDESVTLALRLRLALSRI
eukprot:CAMPEP_0115881922 /NCGR_PEP_ID=MMETSP0287-20121206/28716_1 /TAXON_ID=412157 /ORGANISM="Chrysochromulina rotalis, Strain UIO044" /LENGTH=52 /DNA_ID=CAMNT_0003337939 /DNA_START=289 /DNA_END=447 /DNA_ORIENTATION=-